MRRASGFTLIELVLVMIVISVGLLGLTSLFSNTSQSLSTNEILQQATQYTQECAEKAMATRRDLGFSWFASNAFTCGTAPTGFNRNVTVGNTYTGPVSGACNSNNPCPCPNGVNCRDITVTVTSTANAALNSSITLMLVSY